MPLNKRKYHELDLSMVDVSVAFNVKEILLHPSLKMAVVINFLIFLIRENQR